MQHLPTNPARGMMGLFGLIIMTLGAGVAWGGGAAMFVFGLSIWLDCACDEAVERFTKTIRTDKPEVTT